MVQMNCFPTKRFFRCLIGVVTALLFSHSTQAFNSEGAKRNLKLGYFSDEIFQYAITVDSIYRTKTILARVTDQLHVTNRYITETGFVFSSQVDYSEVDLSQLFLNEGVPTIQFAKTKYKAPVYSLEKVGGTDCDFAQILCSNSSLSGNSAGFGSQELSVSNQGCLIGNEHQSSWYYMNVQTGGSLSLMIDPVSNSDDYDFAIWGPFTAATAGANCPPITAPLRCSFSALDDQTGLQSMNLGSSSGCGFLGLFSCPPSAVGDVSEGAGGDSFVLPLSVLANQIYILLVDNFSTSSNPYSMSFGGTAVLGCTPVVLPVEISSFSGFSTEIGNVLKWKTESEKDNDYFRVERLIEGTTNSWELVQKIEAEGDTEMERNYELVDNSFHRGKMNYYRISQVDFNGLVTTYKTLVSINNEIKNLKVSKIVNLMGQEVDDTYKGVVLYLFEDGTTVRVFQ